MLTESLRVDISLFRVKIVNQVRNMFHYFRTSMSDIKIKRLLHYPSNHKRKSEQILFQHRKEIQSLR